MRFIALLVFLGMWMANAGALECQAPALLKQADGKDDTLHSWCEVKGVREGVYEVVSLKKGLELRANYKKNELDGKFQRFSENGTLVADGFYTGGQMSGEWTRYWSNGEVRDRGTWKDDKPIGRWKSFSNSGELEHDVTYGSDGKITAEEKSRPKENLTSADRWRLRAGFANTKRDTVGNNNGPALGADIRLFGFGRWFRTDLGARIVPDYRTDNGNRTEKTHSGQLALSFDLFPNLTDPLALYLRVGVHLIGFDKPRFMGGFGLRYHLTNKRQNWVPNGIFAELSGADGENDNNGNNNQSSGPGPGPGTNNNSNNNQGGGSMTVFAGALWAFF
ncbi:MAG: toxin-antitoxin system YwqK family antitoxin [Bdellovibrionales bacterium]